METRDLLPLHPLEFRILLVLLEGPAHGYRIVKRIEEREAGWTEILPANLYRRLRDLAAKGLVEESEPRADEGGRRRRDFRISTLGRAVARAEARRLDDLVSEARAKRLLPRPERAT